MAKWDYGSVTAGWMVADATIHSKNEHQRMERVRAATPKQPKEGQGGGGKGKDKDKGGKGKGKDKDKGGAGGAAHAPP